MNCINKPNKCWKIFTFQILSYKEHRHNILNLRCFIFTPLTAEPVYAIDDSPGVFLKISLYCNGWATRKVNANLIEINSFRE